MTPHLNEGQVASFRNRSLAAAELIQVSQHIVECEVCRARVVSAGELYAGVEAVRAILDSEAAVPAHLTYNEIAAYVDHRLADEETGEFEQHVRECGSCAAALAELEVLRRDMAAPVKGPGWFARVSGIWREAFAWKAGMVLAGAAACAALVLVAVRKPAPEAYSLDASAPHQHMQQPAGIRDGKRVIATSPAGIVTGLDDLPARLRASVARAITARQIEVPAELADLSRKRGVLLGSPTPAPRAELIGPMGIVVETPRPTLHWKPVAGAEYQVSLFNDRFEEVAASPWIREADWQAPNVLVRGARYSWQLSVREKGAEFTVPTPPAPEARFRILSAAAEAEITQLKAADPDAHLVLGIEYAQLGLLDEAETELQQAHQRNPDSPAVAALLASVAHMRNPKP
jgi:anti-sigma factor RsiW